MSRIKYLLCALVILSGCASEREVVEVKNPNNSTFQEYCFDPYGERVFGAQKIVSTTSAYLDVNLHAKAAINGTYWGADDGQPQGVVDFYGQNLASGKGAIRGYLVVEPERIWTSLERPESANKRVIVGTHPLLIENGALSSQALENRYDQSPNGRSAIGAKDDSTLCFAVYEDLISMQEWANILLLKNYTQAINLDGGSASQMSVRDVGDFGLGYEPSRLIFIAE